jgi:hypothetical protein
MKVKNSLRLDQIIGVHYVCITGCVPNQFDEFANYSEIKQQ